MKSKTAKITLLSSLALAAFGATNVFADEASTQLNSDTVAAPTADTQASEPAATEKEQSPVVTVVESHTQGNTTTTTSQVTSKELEDAKANANQEGLEVTETETQKQPSVEAADADNKAQAQTINTAVADYQKAKAEFPQKQEQYNKDFEKYQSDVKEYEAQKAAYEQYKKEVAQGLASGRVEKAQGLVFINEPEAKLSIEGVNQYLTKEARQKHATEDILQQYNTDNYTASDFIQANPYDPKEDTWFKMKVGDQISVTYDNIVNSKYNDKKISKVKINYTLNSSTNNEGSALVNLFHDPTKTIFIGAQTSNAGRNDKISVTMQIIFYDENGNEIDLSGNNAIMSLSSLNHWTTKYGDHVEKVNLGDNEFVKIPGSSVDLHGNEIYSAKDNQYKANGATFNGDGADGWDAVNADGTPRAATAYYGAGAMTYKGEPFTFTVGGNDQNLPTTIWFATNSAVAVPKDPGAKPTPPEKPELKKPTVTWHKNLVVETKTEEVPPVTPPTTPDEPTPEKPKTPEDPQSPVVAKSVSFRTARKGEMRVRERDYQPTLPHTGAAKQNGLAALGAISTAFAAATLIAARKKEN
uniref:glucan-binding protein GbpC n=1 Tax=Streptococcus mutans TaxID=1309 RepID=UPI0003053CB1|nr:GbpC/Spa domain-containing protein [Streptococcus mutans]